MANGQTAGSDTETFKAAYEAGKINVQNNSYLEINGGITEDAELNISGAGKVQFGALTSNVGNLNIDAASKTGQTYRLAELKWNSFAERYKTAAAGETIQLTENLTASNGDNSAFGAPSASNITIDGGGFALNAANYVNLSFVLENSSLTFSNISFENFVSDVIGDAGGVLSVVSGSTITVTDTVNFTGSSARVGGAIYNVNALINFSGSTITFTGNETLTFGGAIYIEEGEINFTDSFINFTSNKASLGGGAISNTIDGKVNFNNSVVVFCDNLSQSFDGALTNGGEMNFTSSVVHFINNKTLLDPDDVFSGNGGAASNGGSLIFVGSDVNFTSNSAVINGGAIYNADNSAVSFINTEIVFTSNSADVGGAISNDNNSTIDFRDGKVNFTGNVAASSGGAIYNINDSSATFKAESKDITLTFKDNIAGGELNDIYADVGSSVNFEANGHTIKLDEGIRINGDGTVNKSGDGDLIFEKDSEILSKFIIKEGTAGLGDNVNLRVKDMKAQASGTIDMQNKSANMIEADNFETSGNLKIDVYRDGTNDKIITGNAKVSGNLDIKARVGKYYNKEYEIIIATSSAVSGIFVSTSGNPGLSYIINYTDDPKIVKLIVSGTYESQFKGMPDLTFNQRETAKTFDKLSTDDKTGANMVDFITEYTEKSEEEKLNMLSHTSGYFLANVIRNAAADSPNNEIYDKIRNRSQEDYTTSGLWAQVKGGQETFKSNENSINDYKDVSLGIMFGFDRYIQEKSLMWGVYGRFNSDNIEQGKHRADGQKNGLGLYGGYIEEGYEIKAMLLGSYDMFNTKRAVLGRTAKAEINAITISADIEGALKYKIEENIILRPYIGAEAENTSYGSFKESGAGILNLETEGGNYTRSAGRAGVGIEYDKKSWNAYAKAEGKYLFSGQEPEIESVFRDTHEDFMSRGAKEGKIEIGIGGGVEVRITENWKAFANANYYGAEKYENIYGNAGVRYIFGTKESKEEEKLIRKQKEEEAQARRIAEEERIKREGEINEDSLRKKQEEAKARREKENIKSFKMNAANFETNKYDLKEKAKEDIAKIAKEIKKYKYTKITIEGHTDSTGSDETNKRLSRQRARSVYDEFILNGIKKEKLEYIGFSSRMPIKTNKTKEGRAANRRTEIFVE
jgi:predicted outer membrane repeat protein